MAISEGVPIPGLRGSGDWTADERPKTFRESILKINPNNSTPLTSLLGKSTNIQVADPEYYWWCETHDLVRLQVNGALSDSDTTVVVDSGDPTSTTFGLRYGKATNLRVGDVLMVEPSADASTYNSELLRVTGVTSATSFTVTRGVAGTTPASISDDGYLLLVSSAFAEGTGSEEGSTRNPVKFYNLCQIFKTPFSITGTAQAITNIRTGNTWEQDRSRAMANHAMKLELSFLWGQKQETTGANGKPMRYSAGLRSFIPSANSVVFSDPVSDINDLLEYLEPLHQWDTPSGETRIALCGNSFLLAFNRIIDSAKSIDRDGNQEFYKMKFSKYIHPFGTLLVKPHYLMSRHPLWTKSAFIIDPAAIGYRHTKGRDTFIDKGPSGKGIQDNDEDVTKYQFFTETGFFVDFGGLTCGYMGNLEAGV